jgi:hypothetical protein
MASYPGSTASTARPEHTFQQHVIPLILSPHQDLWDDPGAFALLILDPLRVAQIAQHAGPGARRNRASLLNAGGFVLW